jgi:hypothetical protein
LETTDPALRHEMTITIALADTDHGSDILALHGGLPWRADRRQRGQLAASFTNLQRSSGAREAAGYVNGEVLWR